MSAISISLLLLAPLPLPDVKVGDAISIAERRVPGFTFEAELIHSAEGLRWEVKLLRGPRSWTEIKVCAREGTVLETARLSANAELRALRPGRTLLTARRATELALRYRGGTVMAVEQDRDEGRLAWDVYVQTSTGRVQELEFDARNGAFLGIEDAAD